MYMWIREETKKVLREQNRMVSQKNLRKAKTHRRGEKKGGRNKMTKYKGKAIYQPSGKAEESLQKLTHYTNDELGENFVTRDYNIFQP